jgi:hypothetical protein
MTAVTSSQNFGRGSGDRFGNELGNGDGRVPGDVPSIPLSPEYQAALSEQSIGNLVRDATTHLSTLVRSEIELARAEVVAEARKGVRGSVYFIIALAILCFSLLFPFLSLAEVLAYWMPRWAAFLLIFIAMLVTAALFVLLGQRRMRSIRKPERTINSVRDTAAVAMRRPAEGAGAYDREPFGPTG